MDFLAVPMTISNNVLRLAIEQVRLVGDGLEMAVSDIRWLVVKSSIGVILSNGCSCGQVCMWTFEDEVRAVSSRVEACRVEF